MSRSLNSCALWHFDVDLVILCSLTKCEGGLRSLYDVDEDILGWLLTMATTALVK